MKYQLTAPQAIEFFLRVVPSATELHRSEEDFVVMCLGLRSLTFEDKERFLSFVREMNHGDFVKTVYWGVIRSHIARIREKRCVICRQIGVLAMDLHHVTYQHKGEEWNYLQDLVWVCRACHARRHGRPISGGMWAKWLAAHARLYRDERKRQEAMPIDDVQTFDLACRKTMVTGERR